MKPSIDRFQDPNTVFRHQLAAITDPIARAVARSCLGHAPEEFWTGPSAYSLRYHPPDERGMGGQVIHTKRVFWAVMVLCDAEYDRMPRQDMDILMIAALIHDTLGNHGSSHADDLPDYYLHRLQSWAEGTTLQKCKWRYLMEAICLARTHSGRWSEQAPREDERLPNLLHYADMIASREDAILPVHAKYEIGD